MSTLAPPKPFGRERGLVIDDLEAIDLFLGTLSPLLIARAVELAFDAPRENKWLHTTKEDGIINYGMCNTPCTLYAAGFKIDIKAHRDADCVFAECSLYRGPELLVAKDIRISPGHYGHRITDKLRAVPLALDDYFCTENLGFRLGFSDVLEGC